jgi:uroporphyrinogen-III synthase
VARGSTDLPQSFRAHAFLGAGHPANATHGRWSVASGPDPRSAIDAAFARLSTAAPTHHGPLGHLAIALTGSAADGSILGERLTALGARVQAERVIEFEPLANTDLAGALAVLAPGDALAVTSRQTARYLAGHSIPHGVTVAAVGPACARALAEIGVATHVVGHAGARELATQLALERGRKALFACAQDATGDLERELSERGIEVRRLELYRTVTRSNVALDTSVDARVYMSPSAVAAALAWERAHPDTSTTRFALGHTTAAALEEANLAAVRPRCSDKGVVDELIRQLARMCAQHELSP